MASVPDELLYTEKHEWVSGEVSAGSVVTVGITEYATAALGDIVYVEAPAMGDALKEGEICGELESTKAVSELYSPVTGTVAEVNQDDLIRPSRKRSADKIDGIVTLLVALNRAIANIEQPEVAFISFAD